MKLNKAIERMHKVENMVLHGNDMVAVLTSARGLVASLQAKQASKAQARAARKPDAIGKAIERNARKTYWATGRKSLAMLAKQVRADVAPALALLRETDAMIASGLNCLPSLFRQRPTAPYTTREAAPALPSGLKMPANKCLAPAFNV